MVSMLRLLIFTTPIPFLMTALATAAFFLAFAVMPFRFFFFFSAILPLRTQFFAQVADPFIRPFEVLARFLELFYFLSLEFSRLPYISLEIFKRCFSPR